MTAIARKALICLWPHKGPLLLAFLQVFLITGLELLKPWPLKVVIDNVLGGQALGWGPAADWPAHTVLLAASVALVLVYLVLAGATLAHHYTTIRIGHNMVNELRGRLYDHVQRLSLSFHSRRQVGDLLYRLTSDAYAIQTLTMSGMFPIVGSLVLLAGMFVVMVRLDPVLTFLALVVCPILLMLVLVSPLRRWLVTSAAQMHQQKSGVLALLQWTLPAVRVIQAFTREDDEYRRFREVSEKSLSADLRFYLVQNLYSGAVGLVIAVGTAVVVWVGARHVLAGTLTIGELIVFVAYLTALYGAIDSLSQTYGSIEAARVGVQRVFEILDLEPDVADGTRSFPVGGAAGRVAWEGVSFHYRPDQPVLRDIELRVDVGHKVAIVGRTGVGKSTLLSLLPRFYDPQRGRVTIDGIDVRECSLKSLRQQISMVLQPPLVFPLSIRENIAYGRPDGRLEAIVAAARLARVHEFVTRLPQGYDTVIGEQGATLSEGEKQRLTIARAILHDKPILILDEPTSSVDAETEALIMDALRQLTAGRTTFIIAHRLSTVREADVIVVMREGRIAEQGTFEDLLERGGEFAALYRTQFGHQEHRPPALT